MTDSTSTQATPRLSSARRATLIILAVGLLSLIVALGLGLIHPGQHLVAANTALYGGIAMVAVAFFINTISAANKMAANVDE